MTAESRRERIAVVTTSFPRSSGDAAGHFVLAEVRALQASGAAVVVIAAGKPDEPPTDCTVRYVGGADLFDWPGALPRLRENPLRIGAAAQFVNGARRVLSEEGPFDRVIAHWIVPSAFPAVVGALGLAGFRPSHLEVVAHGSDVRLLARLPVPVRNTILRALRSRGARLRFVSSSLRTELLELPRLPEGVARWLAQESFVAPAAIEVPAELDRARARAKLALSEHRRLVVIAGRLVTEKRIDVAVAAAELIPEALVVVLGGGPLENALAARFPETRFLGQVQRGDALTWIAAADVVVNASLKEGAPTVVREARALHVPVVARPCGDLAQWAQSDSDLWIV